MIDDRPRWAQRMESERAARGWSPLDAARAMRAHSSHELPDERTLTRSWRRWESGAVEPRDHRALIATVFGTTTHAFFPVEHRRDGNAEVQDVSGMDTVEIVARLRASDVDEATLDALRITVDRLCTEYAYMPGDQLLVEGRAWLNRVVTMQHQRLTLGQHRDILALAGMLTLLVGCVEYDSGGPTRTHAEATRQAALSIGREVGHAGIQGWAHEMRAWFALTTGDMRGVISAADAGLSVAPKESVAVQLLAQRAKAWARLGDRRQTEVALDAGRTLLESMPYPENVQNHFVVDPGKWDFYSMDCYRKVGDNQISETLAREVLRAGVDYDGRERSPMRNAEARITLGVVAAREGDLAAAISYGEQALRGDRKSLPSLSMVAGDLDAVLTQRYDGDPQAREFVQHMRALGSR
ncbi:XRE family transcriptional regulator [Streptomyces sp. S.PB5]|uniref:XRE family transcriptional regulator n=1 Tax=Streptomyces sp. S.PB5 TaxID=3020844 RepID=UPI0025AF8201|nr:XRE family transcriptional regulator [Streptomyces sp. S.PB5]MDN3025653.1 XRE family transcriptional regulator [Streptomyces sp. S.PB5]